MKNSILTEQFTVFSTSNSIQQADEFFEKFVQKAELEHRLIEDAYLVLVEALENAKKHGNKNIPNQRIDVSFEKNKQCFCMQVKDQGRGFNHNTIANPLLPQYIKKPNGRGLFIIYKLANKVDFNTLGNQINMTFNL